MTSKAEAAPKWISVDDRLPVNSDELPFVVMYRGYFSMATYSEHRKLFIDYDDFESIGGVTHWIQVPIPNDF